jgi:hypothetical protein
MARKSKPKVKPNPKAEAPLKEKTDQLIRHNGKLVKALFDSEVWNEIVLPLIEETTASVCGRMSNGYYYHGASTRSWNESKLAFYSGYQKCAMDINNRLVDFVRAMERLDKKKKAEAEQAKAPIVNPMLEELDDQWGS